MPGGLVSAVPADPGPARGCGNCERFKERGRRGGGGQGPDGPGPARPGTLPGMGGRHPAGGSRDHAHHVPPRSRDDHATGPGVAEPGRGGAAGVGAGHPARRGRHRGASEASGQPVPGGDLGGRCRDTGVRGGDRAAGSPGGVDPLAAGAVGARRGSHGVGEPRLPGDAGAVAVAGVFRIPDPSRPGPGGHPRRRPPTCARRNWRA